MKRILFLSFVLIVSFVTFTAETMDDNGKAGYVGAPGEATCNTTNCHNSFALNSGGGSVTATCTMNNWKYGPLTQYTITITVAKPGHTLFGFGVEILTPAGTNGGTLAVYDATHTQIKSRTVSGNSRRDIVHKLNGGAGQDSCQFTFVWTSPDTITGPLTMYYAGNATDGNGHPTNDYIYTGTQVISPESTTNVDQVISSSPFSVYPNPLNGSLAIHYSLPKNETVSVKLYDLKGAEKFVLLNAARNGGENNESLNLPDGCAPGMYLLSVESQSGRVFKKILVN